MSQTNRIEGGLIDRSQTRQFTFNGKAMSGYAGDTLASALLANGQRLVGAQLQVSPTARHLHLGFGRAECAC